VRIALCDDDAAARHLLLEHLREYCQNKGISVTFEEFENGESFLQSASDFDIIFMDIYLKNKNGIETAAQYRGLRHSCIVFVTASNDFAAEAFGLNAVHYLLKPVTKAGAADAMDRCIRQLQLVPMHILNVKVGSNIIPIPTGNIIYIEVFNKLSVIHTHKSIYETHMSLSSLYEELNPKTFMRLQRSYIVNMYEIDSFYSDKVILKDKTTLSLSRLNRDDLKKQYQEFLFELAREGQI
jgi:two-component system response regulator LytT